MRRLGLQTVLAVLFCAAFALCGRQAKAAPPFGEFVYVATQNGTIRQFRARSNGTLAPLSPPVVQVAPPKFPVTLVLHPTRPFAYAATVDDQSRKATIYPCRITNGTLVPIKTGRVTLKGTVNELLADPQGRFLFAVGEGGKIFTLLCLRNGGLKALSTNQIQGTFGVGELAGVINIGIISIDPSGRFAYSNYNEGFMDHSTRHQMTYRILPSGKWRPLGEELSDGNGDDKHPDDLSIGEIGFDATGKWAFLNAYYSKAVVLLRPQPNGIFSALHRQAVHDGDAIAEEVGPDGMPRTVKYPVFDKLHLLDMGHSVAVLTGRENELAFAHVAPNAVLNIYGHIPLPGVGRGEIPMNLSYDGHFLTTTSLIVQETAQGREVLPPLLVVVRVGNSANPPKIIQTLPLGGDFVQTIVTYPAHP